MRTWMKRLRQAEHLTTEQVSKKLGISEEYYIQIESGERQKTLDSSLLQMLALIFGVTEHEIVEYEEESAVVVQFSDYWK